MKSIRATRNHDDRPRKLKFLDLFTPVPIVPRRLYVRNGRKQFIVGNELVVKTTGIEVAAHWVKLQFGGDIKL